MSEQTATAHERDVGANGAKMLQRLIRFNTVNPPGDERECQLFLEGVLSGAGFECELLGVEPERPNLIARLRGSEPGPTLAYLGHVDTVKADPDEWTADPWGGELRDGYIWGRGALDMKSQVAAEVAGCAGLAEAGWRPERGELMLVLTADEEAGATKGAKWLCEEHPDKVRCDLVVNEGGGDHFEFDGRRFYALSVAEKGPFRFQLRTRGVAGHASQPRIGENALLKMAPLLEKLSSQPPYERSPELDATLAGLLGDEAARDDHEALAAALEEVRRIEPRLADILVEPMMGVTLTPTKARASDKENVIPSVCEIFVDCRVPPGRDTAHVRERVDAVLGGDGYELEFTDEIVGNASAAESALMDEVRSWVAENDPGAEVLPMVMAGFSDSHWFRKAFDATVYGFFPQNTMDLFETAPLVHGADERIAVDDVQFASRFFADLARRVLG